MNFSGRYMHSGGFYVVDSSKLPVMFKNKRITIETIDELGNVTDSRQVDSDESEAILNSLWALHGPIIFLRDNFRDLFTEEELILVRELIHYLGYAYINEETVYDLRRELDRHPIEKLKFVCDILSKSNEFNGAFNVSSKSEYYRKSFDYSAALKFIESRSGFYFAIDPEGNKTFDFIDEPTKQQHRYQYKKGNRVVFLSFQDWKLHEVKISELTG